MLPYDALLAEVGTRAFDRVRVSWSKHVLATF